MSPRNPHWRRNQIAVVAATFVGFTGFTLVMPFLSLYIQELGVVDTGEAALWTGITLGITPAIVALCSPLWGRIADRFGNKLLVQRSLFSCVVVMALMAKATEPWHLLALRAAQGLLAGYGSLTLTMAARSAPPEQMAAAIGAVQTAQRFGPAIGPVIGGVLVSAVGRSSSRARRGVRVSDGRCAHRLGHQPRTERPARRAQHQRGVPHGRGGHDAARAARATADGAA